MKWFVRTQTESAGVTHLREKIPDPLLFGSVGGIGTPSQHSESTPLACTLIDER